MTPTILLDEATHTYTVGGRKLESVGSVVKRLVPKFDAQAAAERVGRRDGKPTKAVLAEWDAKRDAANDLGHAVHKAINETLSTGMPAPCGEPKFAEWLKWWDKARQHLTVIELEKAIADLEFGIAGTPDALMLSTKTAGHHVFDWKTNGEFRTDSKYREFLLPPFGDLENCEFTVYSLQTSLYRVILERQGIKCGDSWVVHMGQTATPHRMLDLRAKLAAWLKQNHL